ILQFCHRSPRTSIAAPGKRAAAKQTSPAMGILRVSEHPILTPIERGVGAPFMHGIRRTVAQIVRLSLPYFRSEPRWAGRGLHGAILAIELTQVGVAVLLNAWNARFFDALQQKNAAAFGYELLIFSGLVTAFILLAVYQLYLSQGLQIRWRQWMTNRLLGAWLHDSTVYRMQLSGDCSDNPDQRIAEDVTLFVSYTLSLGTGLLGSVSRSAHSS